jgi:hypothetical protein
VPATDDFASYFWLSAVYKFVKKKKIEVGKTEQRRDLTVWQLAVQINPQNYLQLG